MKFCDLNCEYAERPKEGAVDGSGSCMTFQALYCRKLGRYVAKNDVCKAGGDEPDEGGAAQ